MVDVSIVIPFLNEPLSLGHCLASPRDALDRIEHEWKLSRKIVVANNGNSDGSQEIARKAGARAALVAVRGFPTVDEISFLWNVPTIQVARQSPPLEWATRDVCAA